LSEGQVDQLRDIKLEKLKLLEEKARLIRGLPHLYGFKDYKWSREFLESTNKTLFLTAANQLGKSTTQIRKVVDFATNVNAWPSRFRRTPRQFWYLYPTSQVASAEFHTKWKPDILPREEFKDHPQYGWKAEFKNRGDISAIYFNSGVALYFKTYAQDVSHLQSGTVDYVAADEELPVELFDEINFRRNAIEGYFSMCFTATLGQEQWRLTMEPKPGEKEFLAFAHKIRASLFDCQYFLDGTPSHWTLEKINRTIAMCKSEAEVLKRVYGRFVKDEGLKYASFDRSRNVKSPEPIAPHWPIYVGVDIGAGGDSNHPSAITFVAVRPDYRYARVFRHWRGDDKIYTMSDVANKYVELSQDINVTASFYDYHAKDFKTITDRMGLSFIPAEKKHDVGEQVINVLFKNSMLDIDDIQENIPLIGEICSLMLGTDKRKAKDDSVDSMRYALTKIPFDFSHVGFTPLKEGLVNKTVLSPHEMAHAERNRDRIRMLASGGNVASNGVDHEIQSFNELLEVDSSYYDDFF
jgi:phage terminase large subunit-like protein